MIKKITAGLALILSAVTFSQVGINTETPHPSSDLELGSVDRALLLNRVDNTGVVADPQNGMLIYDKSQECVKAYQADAWTDCYEGGTVDPGVVIPEARGTGSLSGRTCFDVAKTDNGPECGTLVSRLPQQADFAETNTADPNYVYKQTYTFKAMGSAVSNVRFTYVDATGKVLQSLVADADYTGNNISTATATATYYQSSLNTDATGLSRNDALKADIYVVYNNSTDGTGTDVQIKLTVNVQDCACCGAYVSATQWKEFLCHNLGADITLDPFTPVVGTNGAYIQWGRRGPNTTGDSRIDWQTAPSDVSLGFGAAPTASNPNAAALAGWSSTTIAANGAWNSGSASAPVKTVNDPCPNGFRIATSTEWRGVIDNNTATNRGSWSPSPTNYTAATYYGSSSTTHSLMLPRAGYRSYNADGTVTLRGQYAEYWTSTESGSQSFFFQVANSATSGFINVSTSRRTGKSIRCISEN